MSHISYHIIVDGEKSLAGVQEYISTYIMGKGVYTTHTHEQFCTMKVLLNYLHYVIEKYMEHSYTSQYNSHEIHIYTYIYILIPC